MSDGEEPVSLSATESLLPCDIVMAGGVTSGIIYPGAVAMIARRFSFHSIGGTSVGAIAAAATAAAEYGRRTGRNVNAFEGLAALPNELGQTAPDGHSRLFHLFTPEPATRPIMGILARLIGKGSVLRKFFAILIFGFRSDWRIALPVALVFLLGLVPAVVLALEARLSPVATISVRAVVVVTALALALITLVVLLVVVVRQSWLPSWRNNGYGICTGNTSPQLAPASGESYQGLTPWIHSVIQRAAGRKLSDPPLTFGDLWAAPSEDGMIAGETDPTAPRAIELSMIASDISRNRTVQLPFIETPSPLYADLEVLRRYYPAEVVEWMEHRAGQYEVDVEKRDGVIRLPQPQDLPIMFGARLSLSFPILLSAVPLLTPDFAKRRGHESVAPLRPVWFSDGGLTSNFPIHFFDSPLPSRPTFCLNLVDFDTEAPSAEQMDDSEAPEDRAFGGARSTDQSKPISHTQAPERTAEARPAQTTSADPMPGDAVWGFISTASGNKLAPVPFTAFDKSSGSGLLSFLSALLNTARFWSDNQMLVAPGVRDRVVHIALRNDEGGLNLDMDANTIKDLDLRGRAAGLLISARFDPQRQNDPETGMPNQQVFAKHRWVRYRNFMAAFEDLSRRFATARRKADLAGKRRGEPLLEDMISGQASANLGYPAPAAARTYYQKVTDELESLAQSMADMTRHAPAATFDQPRRFDGQSRTPKGAAPRPKMRIRLRPLVDNDPRAEHADLPASVQAITPATDGQA